VRHGESAEAGEQDRGARQGEAQRGEDDHPPGLFQAGKGRRGESRSPVAAQREQHPGPAGGDHSDQQDDEDHQDHHGRQDPRRQHPHPPDPGRQDDQADPGEQGDPPDQTDPGEKPTRSSKPTLRSKAVTTTKPTTTTAKTTKAAAPKAAAATNHTPAKATDATASPTKSSPAKAVEAAGKAASKQAPVGKAAVDKAAGRRVPDDKFLAEQQELLMQERASHLHQAESLKDEADALAAEMEPGESEFGEEGGEGGNLSIERELDLVLSAQAKTAVDEIDRAVAKIELGTYGLCEKCGREIPKARLRVLPHAPLCVACKSGGLSRR
jgi:DnaK suppressor protein